MAQVIFEQNFSYVGTGALTLNSNNVLSFVAFNFRDSVSFNTLQLVANGLGSATFSISAGLYSLTGSALSLANSISGTYSMSALGQNGYAILSNTSATQNITPGTWYFGLMASTSSNSMNMRGAFGYTPLNAFQGGFIGGNMTVSTAALPTSYATSDLDTTGFSEMFVPYILVSA